MTDSNTEKRELLNRYIKQQMDGLQKLYDKYSKQPTNSEGPLRSKKDHRVLKRILASKPEDHYVQLFYEPDAKGNIKVHTLGLWLFYGIPELVLNIDAAKSDADDEEKLSDVNIFSKAVIDIYISMAFPRINLETDSDNKVIIKDDYSYRDCMLGIFGTTLKLMRVPEEMYIDHPHIMWFYTYYKKADSTRNVIVSDSDQQVIEENDGLEYKLYPILESALDILEVTTSKICKMSRSISRNINRTDWSEDSHESSDE